MDISLVILVFGVVIVLFWWAGYRASKRFF